MTNHEADQETGRVPRHIAIVMDGNGRWARKRLMPRQAGHRAGAEAVRRVVETAGNMGVEALTLFAFSSENWSRPTEEISVLMELFMRTLEKESARLHEHNVRIRVMGQRERLGRQLREQIEAAEALTADNTGMTLVIAASYGGRWDIVQACQAIARRAQDGDLDPGEVDAGTVAEHMSLRGLPDPDLLIRTGGEKRVSNFLLWHLAYTELCFVDTLWPDFGAEDLRAAMDFYRGRQRRFGRTAEQVERFSRA